MTRSALVTGSAGFIGRHVAKQLDAAGYRITRVDIAGDPAGGTDALDYFAGRRRSWKGSAPFDLVVHCAAVVGGRTMIDGKPAELAAVDLELDAALWRYALRTRPGRVLYWSSSAAYPVRYQAAGLRRRLDEHDLDPAREVQLAPDQTYGLVKCVGERMAAEVRAAGVPVTVVRPFSGYGADQALAYPFPSFVARALARVDPFPVWGPGTQVRDFIHVDDVVAGALRLVELGEDGPVNLCTGRGVSFVELAELVTAAAGYSPTIQTDPTKPVGVHYRVGSPYRLDEFYRPAISLEAGIAAALDQADADAYDAQT